MTMLLDVPALREAPDAEPSRQRSFALVPLGILLATAVALRLIGIARQDLWLDEAFSLFVAAHTYPQILAFVSGSDAHPPLYYLLLHIWLLFGSSEAALRSLSVLASATAVGVLFFLGRRLADQRTAVLAAALLAVSAFQIWYAQEARMYALTTLAFLTAMYGFVRAKQGGGVGAWLLYAGAMLTALYLDYSAWYGFSALILWFVAVGRRQPGLFRPFGASSALVILGYTPWLPAFWRQLGAIGGLTAWIAGAGGTGLPGVIADLLANRANLGQSAGPFAIASLLLVGAVFWRARPTPAFPLLAIWIVWPCVIGLIADFVGHPVLITRNVMLIQPALCMLLAVAAAAVWQQGPGWGSPYRLAMAAAFALYVLFNAVAMATPWHVPVKEQWRSAAALVAGRQQHGDLVLFNAYFVQMPFDYYFRQDTAANTVVTERGYKLEESLLFADLAPSAGMPDGAGFADYSRVWLVLSHTGQVGDDGAVPPWLAQHARPIGQWRYVGVTVRLYQTVTS